MKNSLLVAVAMILVVWSCNGWLKAMKSTWIEKSLPFTKLNQLL